MATLQNIVQGAGLGLNAAGLLSSLSNPTSASGLATWNSGGGSSTLGQLASGAGSLYNLGSGIAGMLDSNAYNQGQSMMDIMSGAAGLIYGSAGAFIGLLKGIFSLAGMFKHKTPETMFYMGAPVNFNSDSFKEFDESGKPIKFGIWISNRYRGKDGKKHGNKVYRGAAYNPKTDKFYFLPGSGADGIQWNSDPKSWQPINDPVKELSSRPKEGVPYDFQDLSIFNPDFFKLKLLREGVQYSDKLKNVMSQAVKQFERIGKDYYYDPKNKIVFSSEGAPLYFSPDGKYIYSTNLRSLHSGMFPIDKKPDLSPEALMKNNHVAGQVIDGKPYLYLVRPHEYTVKQTGEKRFVKGTAVPVAIYEAYKKYSDNPKYSAYLTPLELYKNVGLNFRDIDNYTRVGEVNFDVPPDAYLDAYVKARDAYARQAGGEHIGYYTEEGDFVTQYDYLYDPKKNQIVKDNLRYSLTNTNIPGLRLGYKTISPRGLDYAKENPYVYIRDNVLYVNVGHVGLPGTRSNYKTPSLFIPVSDLEEYNKNPEQYRKTHAIRNIGKIDNSSRSPWKGQIAEFVTSNDVLKNSNVIERSKNVKSFDEIFNDYLKEIKTTGSITNYEPTSDPTLKQKYDFIFKNIPTQRVINAVKFYGDGDVSKFINEVTSKGSDDKGILYHITEGYVPTDISRSKKDIVIDLIKQHPRQVEQWMNATSATRQITGGGSAQDLINRLNSGWWNESVAFNVFTIAGPNTNAKFDNPDISKYLVEPVNSTQATQPIEPETQPITETPSNQFEPTESIKPTTQPVTNTPSNPFEPIEPIETTESITTSPVEIEQPELNNPFGLEHKSIFGDSGLKNDNLAALTLQTFGSVLTNPFKPKDLTFNTSVLYNG